MFILALFLLYCVSFAHIPDITERLFPMGDRPEKRTNRRKARRDRRARWLAIRQSMSRDVDDMFRDLLGLGGEAFSAAAPADPPEPEPEPESVEDAALVCARVQPLMDELYTLAAQLRSRETAASLGRIAASLALLAENARNDERDVPATLRFLDRYGESVLRLARGYAGMEAAQGQSAPMRKSMHQIQVMLAELAEAHERFRLSLFENDILHAAAEIDAARSLLAQDGLDGAASPFAVTEISESG